MSYSSLSTGIGILGERYKHVNDAAATCRSLETQVSSRYHKRGLEFSWLITVSCQKRPASWGTNTWIVRSWCRRSSPPDTATTGSWRRAAFWRQPRPSDLKMPGKVREDERPFAGKSPTRKTGNDLTLQW